jgi:hypothetical protein
MKDLTGFSESFARAFHHDFYLPAVDSGFESLVWRCLQATSSCSVFAASYCSTGDVDKYFPDDRNILTVSPIRWKGYNPMMVSLIRLMGYTLCLVCLWHFRYSPACYKTHRLD